MHLHSLFNLFPISSSIAVAAYLSLAVVLLVPRLRNRLGQMLAPVSPSNQVHLFSLDALRGLAALWVVSYHSWQWWTFIPNQKPTSISPVELAGEDAVAVFVGLSGFLIFRALQSVNSLDGLRRYFQNRFLRIYPLYAISVIALVVFRQYSGVLTKGQHLIAEFFMVRSIGYPVFLNPPSWSLYVEVLFYLVAPCFVLMVQRRVILVAGIMTLVFFLIDNNSPREFALFKFFGIGILASEVQRRLTGRCPEWGAVLIFLFGSMFFWLAVTCECPLDRLVRPFMVPWFCPQQGLLNSGDTIEFCLAVGFLLVGSTLSRTVTTFFKLAPWRILGAISYSIYIWHSFVIISDAPLLFRYLGGVVPIPNSPPHPSPDEWIRWFVIIPAILFLSTLSFLLVERPFLQMRRRVATV